MAMRAQYYNGAFRLPYINGVDEGLVLVEIWFVLTGYFGRRLWLFEVIPGYPINLLTIYFAYVCGIC